MVVLKSWYFWGMMKVAGIFWGMPKFVGILFWFEVRAATDPCNSQKSEYPPSLGVYLVLSNACIFQSVSIILNERNMTEFNIL